MDGYINGCGWGRWEGWAGRRCLPACLPSFPQSRLTSCACCPAILFPPQVGKALGQDLDAPAVQNMMTHAAAQVLGWGSGGGRHAGARLARDEFKRLMEHFRVV